MKNVSIFSFRDYRAFLLAAIKAQLEPWGLIAKMAKSAQCQRPYLSKVLKGDAQLTPSQAYGLARFWRLNSAETDYFLNLLEEERAGSLDYREYVQRKSSVLKKSQEDLARRVNRESSVIENSQMEYYSAWHWTAIHILVSIPEYQSVDSICRRLSLSPDLVLAVLKRLEQGGFVKNNKDRWQYLARESHVPKTSPLVSFHHANWRQKALIDAQNPNSDGIHFTVVQSLSRSDCEQLKELLLGFIEKAAQVAGPSKEEELICLNCDFFKP
jgi:uncharacterized protein (TIGR02147 family)